MASVLNQNSARATLYLYLSTSPRLLSHLGFLFKQPLPIIIVITSFLNKTGLLGQEIHCQSPSYHWVTVSEHQAISIGASERHKSHHSALSSASARYPNAHTGPGGGIPHTLHHLGDLIRQQKRKKVLQEQNGQGNFDTLTGHHQQSPGQHRGTTHGSTEGKESSKKLIVPVVNLSSSCQQTGLFITKFIYKE